MVTDLLLHFLLNMTRCLKSAMDADTIFMALSPFFSGLAMHHLKDEFQGKFSVIGTPAEKETVRNTEVASREFLTRWIWQL